MENLNIMPFYTKINSKSFDKYAITKYNQITSYRGYNY